MTQARCESCGAPAKVHPIPSGEESLSFWQRMATAFEYLRGRWIEPYVDGVIVVPGCQGCFPGKASELDW